MVGIWVIGGFAGMCILRAVADRIMRHGDAVDRRHGLAGPTGPPRPAGSARSAGLAAGTPTVADEAQAWLDQRHQGTV